MTLMDYFDVMYKPPLKLSTYVSNLTFQIRDFYSFLVIINNWIVLILIVSFFLPLIKQIINT